MSLSPDSPFIYLAPIKGITDSLFRNVASAHFRGFDAAIAPFINPQKKSLYNDKLIRDILPENNCELPIVPQLLHTDWEDFLVLGKRLADIGYTHINWNLGCPVPMVAKKKRGSGLLPYPDEILTFLDRVIPKLPLELSIKTRLGYYDQSEIMYLLPRLNQYPLKEIILHTRLGTQLYKGRTDPDGFKSCLELSDHTLVYNGDINTRETFSILSRQFPTTDRWMIGRGFLQNPFLIEEIKSMGTDDEATRKTRLYDFHKDLFLSYRAKLSGPGHLLGRMKMLWAYLIQSFPESQKSLKKILKASSEERYLESVELLFKK